MAWREAPRNLIWALPWDCMSCIIDFLRSHSSLSGASSQALSAQLLSSASQNFVDVPQMESQAWRRSQHASMGVGSDCLALNLRCGCAAAPFRMRRSRYPRPRLKATGLSRAEVTACWREHGAARRRSSTALCCYLMDAGPRICMPAPELSASQPPFFALKDRRFCTASFSFGHL